MQNEHYIWLVGNQKTEQQTLSSALHRHGLPVSNYTFDTELPSGPYPEVVVFFLTGNDCDTVRNILERPVLKHALRIYIVGPSDRRARLFCATADMDDLILKPIRLREAVERIRLVHERAISHDETVIHDIHECVRQMKAGVSSSYTGSVSLEGRGHLAELYFRNGRLYQAVMGDKTGQTAAGAAWRTLPAVCEFHKDEKYPGHIENGGELSVDLAVKTCIDASALCQSLGMSHGLDSVLRLDGQIFNEKSDELPRQVLRMLFFFDGAHTVDDWFQGFNLDEVLLAKIIKRLCRDGILIESKADTSSGVTVDDWLAPIEEEIPSESDPDNQQPPAAPDTELFDLTDFTSDGCGFDKPTPSSIFYALDITGGSLSQSVSTTSPNIGNDGKSSAGRADKSAGRADQNEHREESVWSSGLMPVVLHRYSRAEIERHMAEAHEPLVTACCIIPHNRCYSDAALKLEEEREREQDEALLNIMIDETQFENEVTAVAPMPRSDGDRSDEDEKTAVVMPPADKSKLYEADFDGDDHDSREDAEDDEPDDEWFGDDAGEAYSSGNRRAVNKFYKENQELPPDQWKEQIIRRNEQESMEQTKMRRRILIVTICLGVLSIIAVILFKDDGSPEVSTLPAAEEESKSPEEPVKSADLGTPDQNLPDKPPSAPQTADSVPDIQIPIDAQTAPETGLPAPQQAFDSMPPVPTPSPDVHKAAETVPARPAVPSPERHGVKQNKTAPAPEENAEDIDSAEDDDGEIIVRRPHQTTAARHNPAPVPGPKINNSSNAQKQEEIMNLRSAIIKHDADKAQALAGVLSRQYPDDPRVQTMAGDAAALGGDFKSAVMYYKKTESKNKNNTAYWVKIAKYYRGNGQIQEADESMRKAIAIVGPDTPQGQKYRMMLSDPTK